MASLDKVGNKFKSYEGILFATAQTLVQNAKPQKNNHFKQLKNK